MGVTETCYRVFNPRSNNLINICGTTTYVWEMLEGKGFFFPFHTVNIRMV